MSYCFYGEALLPNINTVWTDKSVYPYALIRSTINGDSGYPVLATLIVSTTPLYFDASTNSGSYRAVVAGSAIRYQFDSSGEWEYIGETAYEIDEEVCTNFASALGWTNTDILNTDGTVYLAASDPIPVNPAPTLDPTALLMGWQVGNRIRGGA